MTEECSLMVGTGKLDEAEELQCWRMQHLLHYKVAMPLRTGAEKYKSIQPDSVTKARPF